MKKVDWKKWGLLPGVAAMGVSAVLLLLMRGDASWPLHFNLYGAPDRWGKSSELWLLLFVQIILLIMFFVMDEGIRKAETKHNFTGAIASGISVSLTATLCFGYWIGVSGGSGQHSWLIPVTLSAGIAAGVLAFWLDRLRPQPEHRSVPARKLPDLSRGNWFYWESFNPGWMNAMLYLSLLLLLIVFLSVPGTGWMRLMFIAISGFVALFLGGFQFTINATRLCVSIGYLRIPCFRVKLENISSVEVVQFNPIARFGGLGFRYSPWAGWGLISSGSGVQLETRSGRRLTISCEEPELIVALLKQVAALKPGEKSRSLWRSWIWFGWSLLLIGLIGYGVFLAIRPNPEWVELETRQTLTRFLAGETAGFTARASAKIRELTDDEGVLRESLKLQEKYGAFVEWEGDAVRVPNWPNATIRQKVRLERGSVLFTVTMNRNGRIYGFFIKEL